MKTAQKGNILIILLIIAAVVAGAVFYLKAKPLTTSIPSYTKPSATRQSTSTQSAQQTKTFRSSNVMRFSIELPAHYQVTEKFGSVILTSAKGTIYIDRNGTNFDNLEDYVKDLTAKNKSPLLNQQTLQINGLYAIVATKALEKVYFIYKDYAVYTITAKTESLFNDLDRIAQTFRYTP